MIVGFFLIKSGAVEKIRSIEIIAWTTLIFGFLLYISDKFELKKNIKNDFNLKSAIIIGLLQISSLIPGVSRSGIAITAARFLKFKRTDAAKISFLISIPILGAVSGYGFMNILFTKNINFTIINLLAIILSFLFSLLTIKYFLKYIKKFSLNIFVYYRLLLGFILLMITYL
jgi:undecaprenyl-diphosphatase